jgi:glycosyltransferase involved in cell wall biosynthesis
VDRIATARRDREALLTPLTHQVARLRSAARVSTEKAVHLLQHRPVRPRPLSAEWRATLADALLHHAKRAEAAERQSEGLNAQLQRTQDAPEGAGTPDSTPLLDDPFSIVDDLQRQLERRTLEVATATAELTAIQQSRAWRTIMGYRRLRTEPRRIVRGGLRRVRAATAHVKSTSARLWQMRHQAIAQLHPAVRVRSARERLRQWLETRMMNPYVFLFDRYKRARMATYGPHLGDIRAASEPGLVSIVLPAYNGAAMIASSIDSVLAQTYPNFELIIVDDGSTDETPRIAAEYADRDSRVRVISQENQKLPRALSRGFRDARGEFLTWTSCDNRLKPDFCDKLVACLRRHPSWDMAYANLDLIGEDGEYLRGSGYWEGQQRPWGSEHVFMPGAPLELNVWANNTVGGAFMYRRRIAALVGEYSPYRFIAEDYDYWMRINAMGVLRHADFSDPVYDYRFHSGSLKSRWEEFRMLENRDRLMIFEEFRRDFYLAPMLWIVDADPASSRSEAAIDRQLRRIGHLRYTGTYPLQSLARLWMPVVHLRIAAPAHASTPPAGALSHALKVFVTTDRNLPADVDAGWDLCIALGRQPELPRLPDNRGWIAAPDAVSLVHAIDVRAKSQHLALMEAEAEAPPAPQCAASVVICSYQFGPRTIAALDSVLAQHCDRSYEILVVHNTSATPPATPVPPGAQVPVREIVCPLPGLSAARNAAIAEARGEIVCFLDDDAIASPLWLQRLCEAFEAQPDAGVIGGHIYLNTPESRPAALRPGWERYWSHFVTGYAGFTRVQHYWEFPWGANWAARRAALVAAGGFRMRYGRTGDNFWGGEELVTASVIQKLGYAVAVVPEASVRHDVDPARFTFSHARRTLRAAHQVAYAAQRDLYISNETGVRRTFSDFFISHYDESIPAEYRHWRNASHRKRAQFRLMLVQLRDLARRLRKPAVTIDP